MDTNLINDISWKKMTKRTSARDWLEHMWLNASTAANYMMGADHQIMEELRRPMTMVGTPYLEPVARDYYYHRVVGQPWTATGGATATWLNNLGI